jgi:hypothetical protein
VRQDVPIASRIEPKIRALVRVVYKRQTGVIGPSIDQLAHLPVTDWPTIRLGWLQRQRLAPRALRSGGFLYRPGAGEEERAVWVHGGGRVVAVRSLSNRGKRPFWAVALVDRTACGSFRINGTPTGWCGRLLLWIALGSSPKTSIRWERLVAGRGWSARAGRSSDVEDVPALTDLNSLWVMRLRREDHLLLLIRPCDRRRGGMDYCAMALPVVKTATSACNLSDVQLP